MNLVDFLAKKIEDGEIKIFDMVKTLSLIFNISKSDARRLINQKAVKINGNILEERGAILLAGDIIKLGSRRFARLKDYPTYEFTI